MTRQDIRNPTSTRKGEGSQLANNWE
jgi:hypothetical protein